MCVYERVIIGSSNGSSPVRCQVITWTNASISYIGSLKTNFSGLGIKIPNFRTRKSIENSIFKMSAISSWPQCIKNVYITLYLLTTFPPLMWVSTAVTATSSRQRRVTLPGTVLVSYTATSINATSPSRPCSPVAVYYMKINRALYSSVPLHLDKFSSKYSH